MTLSDSLPLNPKSELEKISNQEIGEELEEHFRSNEGGKDFSRNGWLAVAEIQYGETEERH